VSLDNASKVDRRAQNGYFDPLARVFWLGREIGPTMISSDAMQRVREGV
jgi:hypothetical protein